MKTELEKGWRIFARLGLSLLCASGTGLLLAFASYFIAIKLIPAKGTPVGHTLTAVIVGIASGVVVITRMTRTFVLRSLTD